MKPTALRLALGRPSNNLKGGIVGLANVGKSTFFQAITKSELGTPANFPFATIDPEKARVVVPSPRFDQLCEIYKPRSKVPADLTVFDIAGLVKGAANGDGLGNAFLSHIRAVDGLFQVVRAFHDPEITHIEGSVNAVRDLDIILDELKLKDMEFAESFIEQTRKKMKRGLGPSERKAFDLELEIGSKVLKWLEDGNRIASKQWTPEEEEIINSMSLLTAKPCVYIANVGEEDYAFGDGLLDSTIKAIQNWIDKNSPGDPLVQVAVNLEHRLASLPGDQAQAEMEELGIESALPQAIKELRRRLGLISYFTCGPDEVREWTVRDGATASEAAGVIHNDLQKTFILANVTSYSDAIAYQGDETQLKSQGKVAQRGKDYTVQDGEIMYFKAGAGKR